MEQKVILKYYKGEEDRIKIFGDQFVKNNKDKLKMEINGEIRELNEYYDNNKIKNK